jgi:mannose-6-phosphate isomerase-like protein (cupin superfamily)
MSAFEPLGDVANRFLFENERVKVWEMLLEPGEASAPHRHDLDYMLIILEGESIDADSPDGPSIHLPVRPGQVLAIPPGRTEIAINRSDVRYREILVELKQAAR